jgi:hypothetical protein
VGDLDAEVERTLAAGTGRLRLLRARDGGDVWWEAGHGAADFRERRAYVVFRPIPPDAPPIGLPPTTEYEYLFDGGRRWGREPGELEWSHPSGTHADPRQAGDPTWILDALRGATIIGGAPGNGHRLRLDLREAARALGRRLDRGPGRLAFLSASSVRAWQVNVPAAVWLDAAQRISRVEHLDPPGGRIGARLTPHRTWNGLELVALGEPVELPKAPHGVAASGRKP